jgi:MerR family copper efflux transcriptional regulator
VAPSTYQIGEVVDRVGLSVRTVRYYEEIGLVTPSDRTAGGFRLYTDSDIERLQLAKHLKPLGFSLDEMRELLDLHERLHSRGGRIANKERDRLTAYAQDARRRCDELRKQLHAAEQLAGQLERDLDQHPG